MDHLRWLFSELARTALGRGAAEQFAPATETGEGTKTQVARIWPVEQAPLSRREPAEPQRLSPAAVEDSALPAFVSQPGEVFTPEELSRFFERDARRYG